MPYTNKIDELHGVVTDNNPEVVLITESWLSSSIPDSAMSIGNEYTRNTCMQQPLANTERRLAFTSVLPWQHDNFNFVLYFCTTRQK